MNQHEHELERIRSEYRRRMLEIAPDRYSYANPDNILRHAGVVRGAVPLLRRAGLYPLNSMDVLEVGCGGGDWLVEMLLWGADPSRLSGVDLDDQRIVEARRRLPGADLRVCDASATPWMDASFDVITQFTVFSSILDAGLRRAVAAEMLRLMRPGGAILWWDLRHDNPNNPKVRGIGRQSLASLFPSCRIEWRSATLAPPLARATVQISWTLAVLLEAIPVLRSHALALIRKS